MDKNLGKNKMSEEVPIEKQCCIVCCKNEGTISLKEVEGTFNIKNELINTRPIEWKLCTKHFMGALEYMRCCVIGCDEKASYLCLPDEEIKEKDQELSHNHICIRHYREMVESTKKPIKRIMEEPTDDMLPVLKKNNEDSATVTDEDTATAEDDKEMKQGTKKTDGYAQSSNLVFEDKIKEESNLPKNPFEDSEMKQSIRIKQEVDTVKKCCFSNCLEGAIGTIKFLHPLKIPVCATHQRIITKLMRKALLDQQIVLSPSVHEMILSCNSIHFHPLSNYKKTGNDGKCALCFGYINKKPIYICSTCNNVFCAECQKTISAINGINVQQPSAHWKCAVCYTKGMREREDVLKREVVIVREAASKRLDLFMQKEGKQVHEKMQQEREKRLEKIEKRKKQTKRTIQWLNVVFPKAVQLKWRVNDSTIKVNQNEKSLFVFSKTQTNYFLCPQSPPVETLIETLHSIAETNNNRIIKEVKDNIPFETIILAHDKQYADILKQILDQKDERTSWSVKYQLNSILADQPYQCPQFCLSEFYLRVSLETTQGICESLQFLGQNQNVKVAYMFTGARGGVVPFEGLLEKKEGTLVEDNKIVIKLTPDENINEQTKPLVMIMKKNPMEFPTGIKPKVPADVMTSSYFLNYTAIGVKYALKVLGLNRIAVVVFGDMESERGTTEILKEEIRNNEVLVVKSGDEWIETEFKVRVFEPQVLFLCFHCEICNSSNSIEGRIKKVAKDLAKMTKTKANDDFAPPPCQIVSLFQHGIVQDVYYEKYRSAIRLFVESLNEDL